MRTDLYLNFSGNTEEAFNFYKSVFGGEFMMIQKFKDMPGSDKMPPFVLDKILHVSYMISENLCLMGSDSMEGMGKPLTMGTNFSISIKADTNEEADSYYAKLSDGGNQDMPLANQFWGAYFGTCTDKFGVQWMVSCEPAR